MQKWLIKVENVARHTLNFSVVSEMRMLFVTRIESSSFILSDVTACVWQSIRELCYTLASQCRYTDSSHCTILNEV